MRNTISREQTSKRTWRDKYRPLIARILAEHAGKPEGELRKILREAFPSGPREYHPYKTWLDEIRVQLGKKKPAKVMRKGDRVQAKPCAGQQEIF